MARTPCTVQVKHWCAQLLCSAIPISLSAGRGIAEHEGKGNELHRGEGNDLQRGEGPLQAAAASLTRAGCGCRWPHTQCEPSR